MNYMCFFCVCLFFGGSQLEVSEFIPDYVFRNLSWRDLGFKPWWLHKIKHKIQNHKTPISAFL